VHRVADMFRKRFAAWGLALPEADIGSRQPGYLPEAGWLVQYTFGRNRGGEYLDYYASHRMTDDEHVRLYDSGRIQYLATIRSAFFTSLDLGEAHQLELAYLRRNRRVARQLVVKGFNKFTLNGLLRAGILEQ
jgi:hypothetical protein